jgi:hypothetical protein
MADFLPLAHDHEGSVPNLFDPYAQIQRIVLSTRLFVIPARFESRTAFVEETSDSA